MPEVLIQFTSRKKPILYNRNVENSPLLKVKQMLFRKTYGSKVGTLAVLLRKMLGEVLEIQHLKNCLSSYLSVYLVRYILHIST